MIAVSTVTHTKLWTVKPSTEITGSPAVDNGTVYMGDGTQVFALNAGTGATKWSVSTCQSPRVATDRGQRDALLRWV